MLRDVVQVSHGSRREGHGRRVDGRVAIGFLFLPSGRPFGTDCQATEKTELTIIIIGQHTQRPIIIIFYIARNNIIKYYVSAAAVPLSHGFFKYVGT